jgi:formate dehydrogenase major subunit
MQGTCDMGSFPHELPGYRHVKGAEARAILEEVRGVQIDAEPGLRIPTKLDAAVGGTFNELGGQCGDILQSDPDTRHVAAGLAATGCVIVHDLFFNQTANCAHVVLPGSTFLDKDGTITRAERRVNRVRQVIAAASVIAESRECAGGSARWAVPPCAAACAAPWTFVSICSIIRKIASGRAMTLAPRAILEYQTPEAGASG